MVLLVVATAVVKTVLPVSEAIGLDRKQKRECHKHVEDTVCDWKGAQFMRDIRHKNDCCADRKMQFRPSSDELPFNMLSASYEVASGVSTAIW